MSEGRQGSPATTESPLAQFDADEEVANSIRNALAASPGSNTPARARGRSRPGMRDGRQRPTIGLDHPVLAQLAAVRPVVGNMTDPLTLGSHRAYARREMPHFVYELWGDRECVYVGLTSDLGQRLRSHSVKEWWPNVVRVVADIHPNRYSGLAAEKERIQELRPTSGGTDG